MRIREASDQYNPTKRRCLVLAGPLELAILGYLWRHGDAQASRIALGIHERYGKASTNTVICTLLRLERSGWTERIERRAASDGGAVWRAGVTREELAAFVTEPIWEA